MSRYFSIGELTHSVTAINKKIDNTPSDAVKSNLEALATEVLDVIREAYGKPLYVSSGYRSKALNKAVGGVITSQHLTGNAADLTTRMGMAENKKLFELACKLAADGKIVTSQIIDEKNGSWLHVGRYVGKKKNQILHL